MCFTFKYISVGVSTKSRFVTVDLHNHCILLPMSVVYLIGLIVCKDKDENIDLPRCAKESFFGGWRAVHGEKIQSTSS